MSRLNKLGMAALMAGLFGFLSGPAIAESDCNFAIRGETMSLVADCTTDMTILIPDGWTLKGGGRTITAVDPGGEDLARALEPYGDHFRGAVVMNEGSTAHVRNLVVQASGLANVCDEGADRLRGILFDGASGTILNNTVRNINQGLSACQEGNAIEVQNEPYPGYPGGVTVEITDNLVADYQKGGIICNGDVDCTMRFNTVGESFTQHQLAANTLQIAFGGTGTITDNDILGNQWFGASNFVATAMLIFEADDVLILRNNIAGNSDVGVILWGEYGHLQRNSISDIGPDGNVNGYDIGVWAVTTTNLVTGNRIRGFDIPTIGVGISAPLILNRDRSPAIPQPFCFDSSPDC